MIRSRNVSVHAWNIGGMLVTEENELLWQKTVPVPLSTINPTWTVPGSNLGLHSKKSAHNCLSHGMAMSRSFMTILNLKMYKTLHVVYQENISDSLHLFPQSNYKFEPLTRSSPQILWKNCIPYFQPHNYYNLHETEARPQINSVNIS
jgi:hypothetical protein